MHNSHIITTNDLIESDYFDGLVLYITQIQSFEEAEKFVGAILTPKEAYYIGQRLAIIELRLAGNTYLQIAKLLSVSLSTIARAARQIQDQHVPY